MTKPIDTTADFFLWKVLMSHTEVTNVIRECLANISKVGDIVEGAKWHSGCVLKRFDKTYQVKMVRHTEPSYMVVDVLYGGMLWRYDSLKIIDAMTGPDVITDICQSLTDDERFMLIDWILNPLESGCLAQEYREHHSMTQTKKGDVVRFVIRKDNKEHVIRYPLSSDPIHTYRAMGTIGDILYRKGLLNTSPLRSGMCVEDIMSSGNLTGDYVPHPGLSSKLWSNITDPELTETVSYENSIETTDPHTEESLTECDELHYRTPKVPVRSSPKINVSMVRGPFATNPDLADLVSILTTNKVAPAHMGIILNPIAKSVNVFSPEDLHDAIQPHDGVLDWDVPSALTNLTIFQLEQVRSIMKTGTAVLITTHTTPVIGSLTDLVGRPVKRTELLNLQHDVLFDALAWLTTKQDNPVAYTSKACDGGTLQHLVVTTKHSRSFSWVYSGPSGEADIMLRASIFRFHDLGFRAPL